MYLIYKKVLLLIILFAINSMILNAQPSFSGFIETSYNYNFSKVMTNTLRSYDAKANQILFNNFHIAASGTPSDKLSYTAELDFGTDAAVHGLLHQAGVGDDPVAVDLQEAYLTYAFSDKFKFTGGKFVTFQGIEVIEGPVNPTISRGYLYGLAEAYTHVGGYITFVPSTEIDIKFGVINGWDLLIDNNKDKSIISRLGVNLGNPLAFGISFYTGIEQVNSENWRNSFDLTGVTKIIPGIALNFQGNYGTETFTDSTGDTDTKWFGFGIQPVISLTDNIDLGFRAEYFADDQGARTGFAGLNAFNLSIVPAFRYDGFTFRFEYRFDNSNQEIFIKETGFAKSSSTISLEISCSL